MRHFPSLADFSGDPYYDEQQPIASASDGGGGGPGDAGAMALYDYDGAPPPRVPRVVTGEASAELLLQAQPYVVGAMLPVATKLIFALRDPTEVCNSMERYGTACNGM